MLITRKGIYKEVTENKFRQIFKDRGYVPVPDEPEEDKSLSDLKFDELKETALAEGLDITGLRSKEALISLIEEGRKDNG